MYTTNIIFKYKLDRRVNLREVYDKFANSGKMKFYHWKPRMLRVKDGANAMIFQSGSVIVNGVTNVHDADKSMEFVKLITDSQIIDFSFVSRTVVGDLKHKVRLYDFAKFNKVEYEPEIFPKARLVINKINVDVYHTGKIVMMGQASFKEMENVLIRLKTMMELTPNAAYDYYE